MSFENNSTVEKVKELNRKLRARHGKTYRDKFTVHYKGDDFMQLAFASKGCESAKKGTCVMCNGFGPVKEVASPEQVRQITRENYEKHYPRQVLLDTSGSVLNFDEYPKENLEAVLGSLSEYKTLEKVFIETHFQTITQEKIDLVRKLLGSEIAVGFELGFESAQEDVRTLAIAKGEDLTNDAFKNTLKLINNNNMTATVNVLCGAPFLSEREQFVDAVKSIKFCFENGADDVVFFPVNIRPNTVIGELYKTGKYPQPSIWTYLAVLGAFDQKHLARIHPAWYGNKDTSEYVDDKGFTEAKSIMPRDYEKAIGVISEYSANPNQRRKILTNFMETSSEYQVWRGKLGHIPKNEIPLGKRVEEGYNGL